MVMMLLLLLLLLLFLLSLVGALLLFKVVDAVSFLFVFVCVLLISSSSFGSLKFHNAVLKKTKLMMTV